jgi:hypothetical protein
VINTYRYKIEMWKLKRTLKITPLSELMTTSKSDSPITVMCIGDGHWNTGLEAFAYASTAFGNSKCQTQLKH